MNFLERLFGRRRGDDRETATTNPGYPRQGAPGAGSKPALSEDEQAVERYRYLLRTAPPETIEAAHAEAFARLTPEQRQLVLQDLSQEAPAGEVADARAADDPRALARLATRAELRNPGALERTWSRAGAGAGFSGVGMGGFMAGSFLSTIAGVVVGSAIANAFFNDSGYDQGHQDGAQAAEDTGAESDSGDTGDTGDTGFDQMDAGGDLGGDIGGDFGDFGGGDFGGEF